ncbi:peptidase, M28 family [Ostertagia ostertagi]
MADHWLYWDNARRETTATISGLLKRRPVIQHHAAQLKTAGDHSASDLAFAYRGNRSPASGLPVYWQQAGYGCIPCSALLRRSPYNPQYRSFEPCCPKDTSKGIRQMKAASDWRRYSVDPGYGHLQAIMAPGALAQPDPVIAAMINRVATDSLLNNTRHICGTLPVVVNGRQDTIFSRSYDMPGNELAFAYLKSRLQQYGVPVDSLVFGTRGKNLFATIKGTMDSTKFILIGAHYDNVGSPVAQGADDNASGVAAVLECLRICATTPMAYTVVFAFWDEEELGSQGSRAYVTTIPGSGRELMGSINMDMIAWDGNRDSTAEIHVRNVRQSPQWAAKAVTINQDYNIGLRLNIISPGSSAMDATSFWNANQPAIAINEDYAHDMNPNWHTVNDTLGNLNLPYFTMITKLSLATLLTYARPQSSAIGEIPAPAVRIWPNPDLRNVAACLAFRRHWAYDHVTLADRFASARAAINDTVVPVILNGFIPNSNWDVATGCIVTNEKLSKARSLPSPIMLSSSKIARAPGVTPIL